MANNIGERELKAGYWYVTHKTLLGKLYVAFLLLLNLLIWGYVLFSLFYNFIFKYNDYLQIKADLLQDRYTNQDQVLNMIKPKSIQVLGIQTLPSVNNRLDVVAQIKNPNTNWVGRFKYNFVTPAGQTMIRKGFVLPGQTKYLYDLDVDAQEISSISIKEVSWTRANDFASILAQREQFTYSNVKFIPIGTEQGVSANRAVFNVSNDSNFNYYRPTFIVILRSSGNIVGFNTTTLDNLYSHKNLDAESRWFETLPSVDSVEVISDIDYLDSSAYIPI